MPPRLHRAAIAIRRSSRLSTAPPEQQKCLLCSWYTTLRQTSSPTRRPRLPNHLNRYRSRSSLTTESSNSVSNTESSSDARSELQAAVLDLQKHGGRFVNLSRLQLALRGLEQNPGKETIRVAVLGLADGGSSLSAARELLRLLLVDPLKAEEEWERLLLNPPEGGKPTLIRVGFEDSQQSSSAALVQELHVSSPLLNGHGLEILVLEADPPNAATKTTVENVLVPALEIPMSTTRRFTTIRTPVHRALIVGEGFLGATSLDGYRVADGEVIGTVANLKVKSDEELPFEIVDVRQGTLALNLFRQSVDNALIFEQQWFASGIPAITEWLKSGIEVNEGSMKPPVRNLVNSVIQDALLAIEEEHTSQLNATISAKISASELQTLRNASQAWAENAHTELRDQLDIAFDGTRWKKLGWWKLFWRVDDVSTIASEILNQRFLTEAEKEIIFISGRLAQAGILKSSTSTWESEPQIVQAEPEVKEDLPSQITRSIPESDDSLLNITAKPWPLHVPNSRTYLSQETVPALQALAQKLVFQTLSTSLGTSTLAGLMYVSSLSTGIYEAGAIAALGIVWSMRRMQGKWETARRFWEGEVREEGRKAVRDIEGAVSTVLIEPTTSLEVDPELTKAELAVGRAIDALKRCK